MQHLLNNFKKRNIDAEFFETRTGAINQILEEIDKDKVVAWGGSTTLKELGVITLLQERNQKLLNRDTAKTAEEKHQIQLDSFNADYYLMSSNAISEEGMLINIDGSGNRVAPLIYGPKKVLVIAGTNKICKTEEEALNRARKYVAPKNTKRLGLKTPCADTGTCHDCLSEQCICNQFVTTRRSWIKNRIKVILINEQLGF